MLPSYKAPADYPSSRRFPDASIMSPATFAVSLPADRSGSACGMPNQAFLPHPPRMDADPHQNEYGNGKWGYQQLQPQPFITMASWPHSPPVVPTAPLVTPVSGTSTSTTVTPVTTTGGPTPRRNLTDDDRRRIWKYHEVHPRVKQTEIAGTSPALYPPPILQLTLSSNIWCRQKVYMLLLIESPISHSALVLFPRFYARKSPRRQRQRRPISACQCQNQL
jgi:hypothetical protein